MPEIGERRNGQEIGYSSKHWHIWSACPRCGKERWVVIGKGKPSKYCSDCARKSGNQNPHWKGGRRRTSTGYILILVSKDHPFYVMARKSGQSSRYIPEHRLVMAEHLGRQLLPSEKVHHKNGIKDDNRLENLELVPRANHAIFNQLCSGCELRKEIRLLRLQMKILNEALQEKLKIFG